MTYQVLARKWRPKSFADMVGQGHVVRALGNALDRDQLHHAYLFTGTRGVGKTTLARILAKALNCEQGVSSTPCGTCPTCRSVDEGRFVDLLEVDAASRTKVDQTRELLENVPYAPAGGRYKVYLIDEVHMFSNSSFNALLKTLEEPPPHVKFLLATTDPQKVPVTVLSRCLQLNLRRLLPQEIRERLAHVLTTEGIEHEPAALALLARGADGSMRDGLSLLDQAIAFGGGRVHEAEVRSMLGSVQGDAVLELAEALAANDAPRLLAEAERLSTLTPDFAEVLRELIGLLHRVALFQQVPATLAEDDPDRDGIARLAQTMAPADVQLFYQIALQGQQDLPLAPDPRAGFEMVLLRALAFRPAEQPEGAGVFATTRPTASGADPKPSTAAPVAAATPGASRTASDTGAAASVREPAREAPAPRAPAGEIRLASTADWHRLAERLGVGGIPAQLAHNCALVQWADRQLVLSLDPAAEQLRSPTTEGRLREALERVLGTPLALEIRVSSPRDETPAQRHRREKADRQQAAEDSLSQDPVAQHLRDQLDAEWIPGSIEPTE